MTKTQGGNVGAVIFECNADGATVSEAYTSARDDALYMNGHGGYTGTIAEKSGFVEFQIDHDRADDVFDLLSNDDLDRLAIMVGEPVANRMLNTFGDKWGPAVALPCGDGQWLFCGWAST